MAGLFSSTLHPRARHFAERSAGYEPVDSSVAPTPWVSESPSERKRTSPVCGSAPPSTFETGGGSPEVLPEEPEDDPEEPDEPDDELELEEVSQAARSAVSVTKQKRFLNTLSL